MARLPAGGPDCLVVLCGLQIGPLRAGRSSILMSLRATGSQLCCYLGRLSNITPASIRALLVYVDNSGPVWINRDAKNLAEYGVRHGSHIVVSDAGLHDFPARPDRKAEECSEEERMLRLAIAASLRELGPDGGRIERSERTEPEVGEEEEDKKVNVSFPEVETEPDESGRPKTPSTGLS